MKTLVIVLIGFPFALVGAIGAVVFGGLHAGFMSTLEWLGEDE